MLCWIVLTGLFQGVLVSSYDCSSTLKRNSVRSKIAGERKFNKKFPLKILDDEIQSGYLTGPQFPK